ncbi:hypothetical protein P9112_013090 [Eukaryota sp. TZLM1-RC]
MVEVRFSIQSDKSVQLCGDFNEWCNSPSEKALFLQRSGSDVLSITVPLSPGVHQYKYVFDNQWEAGANREICVSQTDALIEVMDHCDGQPPEITHTPVIEWDVENAVAPHKLSQLREEFESQLQSSTLEINRLRNELEQQKKQYEKQLQTKEAKIQELTAKFVSQEQGIPIDNSKAENLQKLVDHLRGQLKDVQMKLITEQNARKRIADDYSQMGKQVVQLQNSVNSMACRFNNE